MYLCRASHFFLFQTCVDAQVNVDLKRRQIGRVTWLCDSNSHSRPILHTKTWVLFICNMCTASYFHLVLTLLRNGKTKLKIFVDLEYLNFNWYKQAHTQSVLSVIGPIFLCRFKLYMFSFTFGFMFANICFEKNQNSKIYVMFMINITWNETGICSFWAVWAVRAVGKNQVLACASLVC